MGYAGTTCRHCTKNLTTSPSSIRPLPTRLQGLQGRWSLPEATEARRQLWLQDAVEDLLEELWTATGVRLCDKQQDRDSCGFGYRLLAGRRHRRRPHLRRSRRLQWRGPSPRFQHHSPGGRRYSFWPKRRPIVLSEQFKHLAIRPWLHLSQRSHAGHCKHHPEHRQLSQRQRRGRDRVRWDMTIPMRAGARRCTPSGTLVSSGPSPRT